MATYQQKIVKYYNSRVKERIFRPEDLVLRKSEVSKPTKQGKLSPTWKGPYRVKEVVRPETYRLEIL